MTAPTVDTLRRCIAEFLTGRGETLACVEIGSGGRVAACLTAKAGSSAYFAGGLVLPADASHWPPSLVGEGAWLQEPPGSRSRLHGLVRVVQQAFAADWCLAIECTPQADRYTAFLLLRNTAGSATHTSEALTEDSSQPCCERLVQYALKHLAEKLEENGGETS